MDLQVLTDKQLIALGCRLNQGTFGRDAARMTKEAKMAHCRELAREIHGEEQYRLVLHKMALSILNGAKGAQGDAGPGTGLPGRGDDQDGSNGRGGSEGREGGDTPLPDGTATTAQAGAQMPEQDRFNYEAGAAEGEPTDGDADQGAADQGDEPQGFRDPQDDAPKPPDSLEARVRAMIEEAMDEAADGAAESIAEAVEARLGDAVAALRKEVGERTPREVAFTLPNLPAITTKGRHKVFGKVLALCALPPDLRQPIMLVGPAGSGKSTLGKHVAEGLDRPFGATSLSADMTRGGLEGVTLPIGNGRFVPAEFARMYAGAGVYLLDEIDAAAAEILVTINAATANGAMHIEKRALNDEPTTIPRHDDFVLLAAANTFGTGPTAQYVGRSQMDAATLDRFLIVYMDYDRSILAALMGLDHEPEAPWQPEQRTEIEAGALLQNLGRWLNGVEERVNATGLRRIVGIRSRLRARALVAAGFNEADTKAVLLAGWTPDEIAQVTA